MDLQNLFPANLVGAVHQDVAVESARPQQCRIEDFRPVGRGHENHADPGVEAVHFHEKLVQGLLPLVMAPDRAESAGLAQGVQFVDEDDAGRLLLGLLEKVANTGRSHAHEHLHKFRAADTEEGDAALAGHSLGKHGFARSRRPDQEDTLGNPAPQLGKLGRRFQEFDDLHQLLLGLIYAGNVVEGHVQFVFHVDFSLVLPEGHEAGLLRPHAFHKEIPDPDKEDNREDPGKKIPQKGGFDLPLEADLIGVQECRQLRINADGPESFCLARRRAVDLHLALDLVGCDGDLRYLPRFEEGQKLTVGDDLIGKHGGDVALGNQNHPDTHQDIPD